MQHAQTANRDGELGILKARHKTINVIHKFNVIISTDANLF
jgi:hypothetical protein